MTDDMVEARNWLGKELDCDLCDSRGTKCSLMKACVEDRYAKRIDRFFEWNPGKAKDGNYILYSLILQAYNLTYCIVSGL